MPTQAETTDVETEIEEMAAYAEPEVPAVPSAPTEIQTPTVSGGIRTWGPYADYTFVTTDWGEYGVPKGKVLFFEERMVWDNKEKRRRPTLMPFYVNPGEPLVASDAGLPHTIEELP